MIPRLRTIAILMLLAGLSLGIFTSRALRAMGGPDASQDVSGGQPQIEFQVDYYQRDFRLTPTEADRIRRELYLHDRLVRDRLWELRKQDEDWFEDRLVALTEAVDLILVAAAKDR